MRIALAQVDAWVGDLEGNVARCLAAVRRAADDRASLAVLPEMAVTGPFARDLLLDQSFLGAADEALADLAWRLVDGPTALVGSISRSEAGLHKGVALLSDGEVAGFVGQRRLRADDVFHESRWFTPWPGPTALDIAGNRVAIADPHALSGADSSNGLAPLDGDLVVVSAALPYEPGGHAARVASARKAARRIVFVNGCGAFDELVLEGRSFALAEDGRMVAQLPLGCEQVSVVDLRSEDGEAPEARESWEDEVCTVIERGLQGFVEKNRIKHAFVGLSGGIDSTLVAVLATRALGAARVVGVAMPSRFSDPRSLSSARELASRLGIAFHEVSIETMHEAVESTLGDLVVDGAPAENVQARLRMIVLMAFVNRHGGLLLNTSNKTELGAGYGTLYGDLAGGLSPIGDLTKPQVYRLARHVDAREGGIIPDFVLSRPPSAELHRGQVDPFDYETLGPTLEGLVQQNRSNALLAQSEHKRRQAAPILRLSSKAFGSGRMFPVTRR